MPAPFLGRVAFVLVGVFDRDEFELAPSRSAKTAPFEELVAAGKRSYDMSKSKMSSPAVPVVVVIGKDEETLSRSQPELISSFRPSSSD